MLPQNSQSAAEEPRSMIDGFVHFDATAVRRGKMRDAAKKRRVASVDSPPATAVAPPPSAEARSDGQQAQPVAVPREEVPPAERPGLISLVPLANVALAPSPHGPTAPAARGG